MKKNIAIAMSAMTAVGATAVPAFASEKTTQAQVTVDARTARGEELVVTTDGVGNKIVERKALDATKDKEKIETAKKALEEAKKALDTYSTKKYVATVNGKDEVKNQYTIQVNEKESNFKKYVDTQNSDTIVDTAVVYDVIDNTITDKTKNVVAKYSFVGLQRYDLSFGNGEASDEYKDITFDFATNANYAELAKIKAELKANASKIKLEQKKDDNKDNDATTYNVTLTVKLSDETEVTTITFKNVQKYDEAAMAKEDGLLAANTNGDIKSHWAKTEVLKAMTNGWVDATDTFRPEDQITRAEFVKVVNRAFGIEADNSLRKDFSDVDTTAWYFQDVKAAVRAGYINGYEDGTFKPNQPITRQEAAKIIATVMNNGVSVETLKPVNETTSVHVDVETAFADDASIAAWADESVDMLFKTIDPVTNKAIITGYEEKIGGAKVNSFKPENNITRAEAVVMMQRAESAKNATTN